MRRQRNDTEKRLLILYAVSCLGGATEEQLLRFLVENDLMNYFDMKQLLLELADQEQLRLGESPSEGVISLTENGRFVLGEYYARLPVSQREKIEHAAADYIPRFRLERAAVAKMENGCVTLSIREEEGEMLSVTYRTETRVPGDLSVRWHENVSAFLTLLTAYLLAPAEVTPEETCEIVLENKQMTLRMKTESGAETACCRKNWPAAQEDITRACESIIYGK